MDFEMVQAEDCDPNPPTPEETSELFSRLEDALIKQIEVAWKFSFIPAFSYTLKTEAMLVHWTQMWEC